MEQKRKKIGKNCYCDDFFCHHYEIDKLKDIISALTEIIADFKRKEAGYLRSMDAMSENVRAYQEELVDLREEVKNMKENKNE